VGEAAAAAPADVIVHTVRPTGSVGKEIVAEIESGGYDLLILGARGHASARKSSASVNAHVHFHSKGPAAFEQPARVHDRKGEGVGFRKLGHLL
jgi:Universal stress protein family